MVEIVLSLVLVLAWPASAEPPRSQAQATLQVLIHHASDDAPTVLFVSGANPKGGELPALKKKCEKAGMNLAHLAPGKEELSISSDLVNRRLRSLAGTKSLAGELTVLCHSKGCDAVAGALRDDDSAASPWKKAHVVMINPLNPGANFIPSFMPGWAGEIHPKSSVRLSLFGRGQAHWARPQSVLLINAKGDPIVAEHDQETAGQFRAFDETFDPALEKSPPALDRQSFGLQLGRDPDYLKPEQLLDAENAHGVLLFLEDLFARIERLRAAKSRG